MNTKALLAVTASAAMLISPPAQAQPAAPTLNRGAAASILTRADVRASIARLNRFASLRLQLRQKLGFEDGSACTAPISLSPTDIDMHRSLFVHDSATLGAGNFSLRRTLQKLSDDVTASVPGITPESIFRQFMDTQNDAGSQVTAGNPHCDDNNGKINGFPLNKCARPEGQEATGTQTEIASRIDNEYKPIALVNRIDLADKGWKNCGEHRIVYGRNNGGKNLIIFEAVLPNPKPGCRSGCRDVIDFWVDLSSDSSPASRAGKLENFFFGGLTGFAPVVKTTHYTSGASSAYGGSASGQIRTNQFMFLTGLGQGPWTLKEFKTLLSCAGGTCDYDILPVSVKANPYGVLWSRDVATGTVPPLPPDNSHATPIAGLAALALAFQGEVAGQVTAEKLANSDVNSFSYEVALDKNAAESQSEAPSIDHYPSQFGNASDATFKNTLGTLAAGFGLTGAQIVNRATANSCAGCHLPGAFGLLAANSIAPGKSWPSALAFVHVDTAPTVSLAAQPGFDPAHFGGNTNGFNISPALLNEFLPFRRIHLADVANKEVCDCVPKPDLLATNKARIPQHKLLLEQSSRQIRADLAAADKRFAAKKTIKDGDSRQLFLEKKAIIAKAEGARNAALKADGLVADPVMMKPDPVIIAPTRPAADRLKALKLETIRALANDEPPRETVTGSFRTH